MAEINDQWSGKEIAFNDSDVVAFYRKNLEPSIEPGNKEYPWIAYLTFHYKPKDSTGLPSTSDADVLFKIEDEEVNRLENDNLAIHVAAVLQDGIKDLLFYTRDPDQFLKTAEYFRDTYPDLQVECEISKDEEWGAYYDFP